MDTPPATQDVAAYLGGLPDWGWEAVSDPVGQGFIDYSKELGTETPPLSEWVGEAEYKCTTTPVTLETSPKEIVMFEIGRAHV